jgi:hypothetical protein
MSEPGDADTTIPGEAGGNGNGGGGGGGGTSPQASGDRILTAATDAVVKLIAFLATGAGFVTFVALAGAGITWVRFQGAELPASQALDVVPQDDLVGVGGIALGLFFLLGLIAVAGVYAIDSGGRAVEGMRGGLSVVVAVEVILAIRLADVRDGDGWKEWLAIGLCVVLAVIAVFLTRPRRKPGAKAPTRSLLVARTVTVPPSLKELEDFNQRKQLLTGTGQSVTPQSRKSAESYRARRCHLRQSLQPGLPVCSSRSSARISSGIRCYLPLALPQSVTA